MNILNARLVNQAWAGPFVTPYTVQKLDLPMIDACRALVEDLPEYEKAQAETKKLFEEFRRNHPTYRKH